MGGFQGRVTWFLSRLAVMWLELRVDLERRVPPPHQPISLVCHGLLGFFLIRMAPISSTAGSKQTTLLGTFIKERSSLKTTVPTSQLVQRISKQPRRAKRKAPAKSDRILTDVLLAIKPVHLAHIANREKNHEYRKYRLGDDVTRLWLYETSAGGAGRSSITYVYILLIFCLSYLSSWARGCTVDIGLILIRLLDTSL